MNRREMLQRLAEHPVSVSVDGSAPMPLTPERARAYAHGSQEVRVLDLTVLPGALRGYLKDDGTFDGRRVRERADG